jgi:hypothetical protein
VTCRFGAELDRLLSGLFDESAKSSNCPQAASFPKPTAIIHRLNRVHGLGRVAFFAQMPQPCLQKGGFGIMSRRPSVLS